MERARRQWFPPKDRWFRLSLVVVCATVLLPVLLNLFLSLSWTRQWVARKVGHRVGLAASVGSLTWWPWQGVGVRNLAVEMRGDKTDRSPLLRIDRIIIDPRWTSVLKGKREVESIRLQGGDIVLDPRLLIGLMGQPAEPVQAPSVALADQEPSAELPPPVVSEQHPDPA